MKKILSYIAFNNAESFEAWQRENPDYTISQVQPIMGEANINFSQAQAGITNSVKTFVLYWREE